MVVAALLIGNGFRLRFGADLIDLLPDSDPLIADYKQVIGNFNPLDNMYIDVHAQDPKTTQDELMDVGDELVARMEASKLFSRISYKWNFSDVSSVIDVFKTHRAVLFTSADEKSLRERIQPKEIKANLERWKQTLIQSPAPFLAESFTNDPVGIDLALMKKLESVQSFGSSMRFQKGRLFSSDMRHLLILATPVKLSTDADFTKELIGFVDTTIKQISKPEIHVGYLGGHRYALHNAKTMQSDVALASTLSTVAIILIAVLIFRRRITLPLLVISPAVFGCIAAYGIAPFIETKVSLIAVGCGTMLMGIAIDYGVHILYHLDQFEVIDEKTVTRIMIGITKPLLMSAATTVVAFLCLKLSILPLYHEFAWFATVGIAGTLVFVIFVLPTLLIRLKPSRRSPTVSLASLFRVYFSFVKKHRTLLAIGLVVFTVFCGFGLHKLHFDGDVNNLYATTPEIKKDMEMVNASFGDAIRSTSVIAKGKDLESALKVNDDLYLRLEKLKAEGGVESFHSLSPLLPSQEQQELNRKRWLAFWRPETLSGLKEQLVVQAKEFRMRPEIFESFIDALPGKAPEISKESYKGSFLESMFTSQVASKNQFMVLSNLKLASYEDFLKLQTKLCNKVDNVICVNGRFFVTHVVELVRKELTRLGTYTLIAITILLLGFYGLRLGTLMMLPLFVSLLWTFGILGWLNIPINVMNCIIVLFVFGLVMDCSVFLSSAFSDIHEPGGMEFLERSSGAVALSSMTTIMGVGVLGLTQHPALFIVGTTVLIGMTAGFVAILAVIPLCAELPFFVKRPN